MDFIFSVSDQNDLVIWHFRRGLKRSRVPVVQRGWSQVVESGDGVDLVGLVGDRGTHIEGSMMG